MNVKQFKELVEKRLEQVRTQLIVKGKEYGSTDLLHNFKKAAETFERETPESACWGYMMKHLTYVKDMADGIKTPTLDILTEKIGDSIVYLICMEAILTEGMEGMDTKKPAP